MLSLIAPLFCMYNVNQTSVKIRENYTARYCAMKHDEPKHGQIVIWYEWENGKCVPKARVGK